MGVKKKTKSQGIKGRNGSGRTKSGADAGNNQGTDDDARTRVWQVVAMIPKGKVASYGQIAKLIGLPSHSRFVGRTLRNLPRGTKLPWHRVVNASLRISQRGGGEAHQKRLLRREDVTFIGERIASAHRWEAGLD